MYSGTVSRQGTAFADDFYSLRFGLGNPSICPGGTSPQWRQEIARALVDADARIASIGCPIDAAISLA